ncbi:hypothetical protein ABZS76_04200 [Streptomyces sp. NPDC005562]|uniref:hypothetical protein n=1 Tax=unclassified Streptomyces TaxID=2593676 RepID=UPI0033B29345
MPSDSSFFVIDDSARDPEADIWFTVPAGFVTLPQEMLLNAVEPSGELAFSAVLSSLLDTAPDELTRRIFRAQLGSLGQLFVALCEVGTVYSAIGLHHDDVGTEDDGSLDDDSKRSGERVGVAGPGGSGQPLLSFLTLSWRAIAMAPCPVTAARAVTANQGDVHTGIEYVEDAACGPASLSESLRTPLAVGGLGTQPLLQIHANLPHPDGQRLAVLTLSTRALHRRDDYRRILRDCVGLVSFDDPLG